jgi:hypothetical protein
VKARLQQLALPLTVFALLGLACDRPGQMPREVKRELSDFYQRGERVKALQPPADAAVGGLGGGATAGEGELFDNTRRRRYELT